MFPAMISRNRWMVEGEKLEKSGARTLQAVNVPEIHELMELLGKEGRRTDNPVKH